MYCVFLVIAINRRNPNHIGNYPVSFCALCKFNFKYLVVYFTGRDTCCHSGIIAS